MADSTLILRSRVLTNSAAEYVEQRAGPSMISQVIGPDVDVHGAANAGPEFVSELDRFLPKEDIPE